jgi:Glutathione S-transferase, N-terminal domain
MNARREAQQEAVNLYNNEARRIAANIAKLPDLLRRMEWPTGGHGLRPGKALARARSMVSAMAMNFARLPDLLRQEDWMAEYQLYCFAQSGNAYRAALMLSVIGADWEPLFVDFFKAGVQRTAEYRDNINEMGEAPVLVHGTKKLSQSGVILTYLAETFG